jgi:alpha-D-ribose 1-methylphosphonate 5-triphosphate synthase subunit PhnG
LSPEIAARREMMGLLARARPESLAALSRALGPEPAHDWLRPPQTGTVMLRGRIGGTGAPFNVGEVTVTRCVLRLGPRTGHAHVQGRDRDHARRAALIDALWQDDPARIEAAVLAPLRQDEAARRSARAARAAATRVEFFTLVRGEDA